MSRTRDKRAAALRAPSHPGLKALFNLSPNPYMFLTPDLTILDANEAHLAMTGRHRHEVVGRPLFEVFPVESGNPDVERMRSAVERTLNERVPVTLPLLHYPIPGTAATGRDREDRYWSVSFTPLIDEWGDVELILQHTIDVTEFQALKRASDIAESPEGIKPSPAVVDERFYRRMRMVQNANRTLDSQCRHLRHLFEQAPGFVCILRGPRHVFELTNEAYRQLVGRDPLGKSVRDALPEVEGQVFFDLLDRVYQTGEAIVGHAEPVQLRRRSDEPPDKVYVDFIYQPIKEDDGSVSGIFVQGYDVSESQRLTQELSYQATHDHLTGLVNRRDFERCLAEAVEDARQTRTHHCLLYLNLDQFQVVNNVSGHAAGDELLRHVSDLLQEGVHNDGTVARLGGDEFGILMTRCSSDIAYEIAEKLRRTIAETEFSWEWRTFGLSVSIGVMTFDGGSFTLQEILSTAGSACYIAKEKGRNRVYLHHPANPEFSARLGEMDWVRRLRDALQRGRLVLYTQRIRALSNQGLGTDHQELLVRLTEANGTIVAPAEFIPAAERYNLMPMIDRYVIQAALKHHSGLPVAQRDCTIYGINLSGMTFSDEAFLPFVQAQVAEHGVSPHQICFEITETAAIANLTNTARLISELKALGFKFALDDFGSGMSSFGYLKSLPVDFVKIDGRFVRNILNEPVDVAIVEAITNVAHLMGIQTVAEYVENDTVLELLASIGVDFAQGYGVHRPEPL